MTNAAGIGRPLPARDAYRLWAPGYDVETVVSALERRAVDDVTPDLRGRALLDAGCGTGRRHAGACARLVAGIDLVIEMIEAGTLRGAAARAGDDVMIAPHREGTHAALYAAADLQAIPFRDGLFDVVWCRLVLGHMRDIRRAYTEFARVAADGARLVVSDFHPVAARAGHTRSFRASGTVYSIEHHVHEVDQHIESARHCGWHIRQQTDLCVGEAVRSHYEAAGVLDRYEAQLGLPLVMLLVFER